LLQTVRGARGVSGRTGLASMARDRARAARLPDQPFVQCVCWRCVIVGQPPSGTIWRTGPTRTLCLLLRARAWSQAHLATARWILGLFECEIGDITLQLTRLPGVKYFSQRKQMPRCVSARRTLQQALRVHGAVQASWYYNRRQLRQV